MTKPTKAQIAQAETVELPEPEAPPSPYEAALVEFFGTNPLHARDAQYRRAVIAGLALLHEDLKALARKRP